jgi:hypothetical protein
MIFQTGYRKLNTGYQESEECQLETFYYICEILRIQG